MRRGFLYLVAIIDWSARKVPAWRISNTLGADFCVEALSEVVHCFGPSEIMNTDQGLPFTSFAWTDRLKCVGTRISMKYECVYLRTWKTGPEARTGIGK